MEQKEMVQEPAGLAFDDPSFLGVPPAFRPIKAWKKAGAAAVAVTEMQRISRLVRSPRSSDARA